jgi:hypothetical protein
VSGTERVQVNGLYDEVRSKLNRGRQVLDARAVALLQAFAALGVAIAGVTISVSLGWLIDRPANATASVGTPDSILTPAGLGLISGLVVVALAIGREALPTLEILPEGRGSAFERWRTRISGAIAAMVLGVAASAVWGTLGHLPMPRWVPVSRAITGR